MQYKLFDDYGFKFFSFGSGSSGNCYYLGTTGSGLLLDAGLTVKQTETAMQKHNIDFNQISAILITHEHNDHIKAAEKLSLKYKIPVYTSSAIHRVLKNSGVNFALNARIINKNKSLKIKHFNITAFDVPHDSCENMGYMINFDSNNLVLITDAGMITPEMTEYAKRANHLVLECNYDSEMLKNGRYPYYLKRRVSGGKGHLSNVQTGNFIAEIINPAMRNIFLCHLSKNNNTPTLAISTVTNILKNKEINTNSVRIEVLNRDKPTCYNLF